MLLPLLLPVLACSVRNSYRMRFPQEPLSGKPGKDELMAVKELQWQPRQPRSTMNHNAYRTPLLVSLLHYSGGRCSMKRVVLWQLEWPGMAQVFRIPGRIFCQ